ncbi:MAG TPA: AsmA family protein [Candidatus Angelobacter sp.]|nr:AsmA family protein [Candidatus Angelobacter sp.]
MMQLRKWWKAGLAVVLLFLVLQVAVSLFVRTHRAHDYLVAHLARAFGRPVEVGSFDVRIFPSPQIFAEQLTVGEDPAFGYEYFLRAERLKAGLRWLGVLRGHFDFGTLSLTRPSLILVRNSEGRWNLERWLPPAKASATQGNPAYGPAPSATPVNRLERIEFDEGRINFKIEDDKLPIAFIAVSGRVEQFSSGRWQLQLEAQPWRSGALLQSAGTIRVVGDIAGTSARLQPAELSLHWSEASLADVLRLFRGQDYGVRGLFALDAGVKSAISRENEPGDWVFTLQARARQIHRWDLTERADNPALNAQMKGRWNIGTGTLIAEEIALEGPRSNLRGKFRYAREDKSSTELRLDSLGIQAADLLAWYRAFHTEVAEGVTAEQYFTGGMIARGWPPSVESAALSSNGGVVRVPGFTQLVRVGPVNGGCERSSFIVGPVRVALGGGVSDVSALKRPRVAVTMNDAADIIVSQDLKSSEGSISVEGNTGHVQDFLKLFSGLGYRINHGWDLSGQATPLVKWEWKEPFHGQWNGSVILKGGSLNVAGLNQPLRISESAINWSKGKRSVRVTRVEGFGGAWAGTVEEKAAPEAQGGSGWKFHLSVDTISAAELDRWLGPRARPTWVQQLLASLLGGAAPTVSASELVRRVDAEGELDIAELTVEKMKLESIHAKGSLRNLQLDVTDAHAEWAGGKVSGKFSAKFLPRPSYDIAAQLERINLAKVPNTGRLAERVSGFASGTIHLATAGVGREELLAGLSGEGEVHLAKVELRGWDVAASISDGAVHQGNSRWPAGECAFLVNNRNFVVLWLQLDAGREQTSVEGKLSFGSDADLRVTAQALEKSKLKPQKAAEKSHTLKISGPLDRPRVTLEKESPNQAVN